MTSSERNTWSHTEMIICVMSHALVMICTLIIKCYRIFYYRKCITFSFRDRYIKERKIITGKKSCAGTEQKTMWKYFSIMNFLGTLNMSLEESPSIPPGDLSTPGFITLYPAWTWLSGACLKSFQSSSSLSNPALQSTDESFETLPDSVSLSPGVFQGTETDSTRIK